MAVSVCRTLPRSYAAEYVTPNMTFGRIVRSTPRALDEWFRTHPDCVRIDTLVRDARAASGPGCGRTITLSYCVAFGGYTVVLSDDPGTAYVTGDARLALDFAYLDKARNGGEVVMHETMKFSVRYA